MKVAVPTNDGTSISAHFGRSAAFLVFEVQDGVVTSHDTRINEPCSEHAVAHHHQTPGARAHDHKRVLETIKDCAVVLCRGMGQAAGGCVVREVWRRFSLQKPDPPDSLWKAMPGEHSNPRHRVRVTAGTEGAPTVTCAFGLFRRRPPDRTGSLSSRVWLPGLFDFRDEAGHGLRHVGKHRCPFLEVALAFRGQTIDAASRTVLVGIPF